MADGRANAPPLGRYSLNTSCPQEARTQLNLLDRKLAIEQGLAIASSEFATSESLSLSNGRHLYEEYTRRPRVAGGPSENTRKRYRAVFDKFMQFARDRDINTWQQVDAVTLNAYAGWLDRNGWAYATPYLELMTLKQVNKWLIEQRRLLADMRIILPMPKPDETEAYCWRAGKVDAMVAYCSATPELAWLGDIIAALACTGLRISELAALRWSDIDFLGNDVAIKDESTRAARKTKRDRRTTKGRRSHSFPLHPLLRTMLERLERSGDGLVFHGPRGARIKPDTLRNILVREVIANLRDQFPSVDGEAGFADGRLHSFRHYSCSTCANTGVPEQVVMHWLGHRSSRMVRHYYHLHDDEAQRQMQRVHFLSVPTRVMSVDVSKSTEGAAPMTVLSLRLACPTSFGTVLGTVHCARKIRFRKSLNGSDLRKPS